MVSHPDLFDFPTAFPLKVIGKNENDFAAFVLAVMEKHTVPDEIQKVSERLSRNDSYLAVTVTFIAQSREQLDRIYSELSANPRVLMVI
jgi:putative lipoic acid-binding regulatory protein